MPLILALLAVASAMLLADAALAQEPVVGGAPTAWQVNFQPAASPVAEMIESLHDLLLFITVAISVSRIYAGTQGRTPASAFVLRATRCRPGAPTTACSRSPGPRFRC